MTVTEPLVPVTMTPWGLEYSIHGCPRCHLDEIAAIFPNLTLEGLLIIPTCQKSEIDLVNWGEQADKEKDRLLEQFVGFAQKVCATLALQGYWADYIDPCSGLPMIHKETNAVYGEVEAMGTLLGYKAQNAGCCKIILHPRWGSSVYPATMFAKGPLEILKNAIAQAI